MSWRNRGCRKISDVDGCSIVKFPWWAKIRMIKRHILPIGANTVLNLLFGKGCWKDIQDWLLLKSRAWNAKGLHPPHILQKHPQGVPTNSGLSCPGKATPTMHKVAQNGQPTFFYHEGLQRGAALAGLGREFWVQAPEDDLCIYILYMFVYICSTLSIC